MHHGDDLSRRELLKLALAASAAAASGGWPLNVASAGEVKPRTSPAQFYADSVLAALQKLPGQIELTGRIAARIAERVMKGGALRLVEKGGGLGEECARRAGGMILVNWPVNSKPALDTILLGSNAGFDDYDAEQIKQAHSKSSVVVALCSHNQQAIKAADAALDNFAPRGDRLIALTRSKKAICPMGLTVNMANLWMLECELVSAFLRRGKMPVVLKSISFPDSRARNDAVDKQPFHAKAEVAPRAAGEAAAEYLRHATTMVTQIRDAQTENVRKAAQLAADTRNSGGSLYIAAISHVAYHFAELPDDPKLFQTLLPWDKDFTSKFGKRDLVFFLAYVGLPDVFEATAQKGCRIVWSGIPKEGESLEHPALAAAIEQNWLFGDACVPFEGYDCRVGPLSGIAHALVYYMLCAELAVLLERT